MMNEQIESDIKTVLDYCWHDEERSWLESGEDCEEHIFYVLRRLAKAIKYEP